MTERDELGARLFEAAEADRRLALERAIVDEQAEGERRERQRRSIVRKAFAAWQGMAQLERRWEGLECTAANRCRLLGLWKQAMDQTRKMSPGLTGQRVEGSCKQG